MVGESNFLRACRGEAVERRPVWFMRQAGRSLPEYRAIRGHGSILEAIAKPELAAEITLQPVRRYGVDAAILYSDIVVPLHAIGFGIEVVPGTGPVIEEPFRTENDLQRLRSIEPEIDMPYVIETVKLLVKELEIPLIGFAGAPFTLASYLIEGRPSRTWEHTKTLMHSQQELWAQLMDSLAEISIATLRAQVMAGAGAAQVFDSWVGALALDEYTRFVLPATRRIFEGIADLNVPAIYFGVGTGELLPAMSQSGCSVVGIDWRVPLDVAAQRLGGTKPVQGNLDPAICLAPWEVVEERALDILRRGAHAPGHIFNLGHGVLPDTNPDTLARLVELVHDKG